MKEKELSDVVRLIMFDVEESGLLQNCMFLAEKYGFVNHQKLGSGDWGEESIDYDYSSDKLHIHYKLIDSDINRLTLVYDGVVVLDLDTNINNCGLSNPHIYLRPPSSTFEIVKEITSGELPSEFTFSKSLSYDFTLNPNYIMPSDSAPDNIYLDSVNQSKIELLLAETPCEEGTPLRLLIYKPDHVWIPELNKLYSNLFTDIPDATLFELRSRIDIDSYIGLQEELFSDDESYSEFVLR